jgi:gas vesicle protein
MIRFLVGMIVGVFLGVLVIAPNASLSSQVQDLWADLRVWAAALVGTAQDVARDVGQEAERLGEETQQEAEEVGREAGDALR